jgi:hypothetical protein
MDKSHPGLARYRRRSILGGSDFALLQKPCYNLTILGFSSDTLLLYRRSYLVTVHLQAQCLQPAQPVARFDPARPADQGTHHMAGSSHPIRFHDFSRLFVVLFVIVRTPSTALETHPRCTSVLPDISQNANDLLSHYPIPARLSDVLKCLVAHEACRDLDHRPGRSLGLSVPWQLRPKKWTRPQLCGRADTW